MRVGSLVECVNGDLCSFAKAPYTPPIKGKIYTVRDFHKFLYGVGIRLEEIKNRNILGGNIEIAFDINKFRELLPPIPNVEEHINENTLELEPC